MHNLNLKVLPLRSVIITSLLCLLAGHLVIQAYFPFLFVNFVGIILLFFIISSRTIDKNDVFAFILVIYLCSHFQYAINQGGAFNLLSFALIVYYFYQDKNKKKNISLKDPFTTLLIFILVMSNICGWMVKNEISIFPKILGIISFFSYILMFNLLRGLLFTLERLKAFLFITIIVSGYMTITALNQYFAFYKSNSPMVSSLHRFGSITVSGMFGNSELYGEHALLTLILIIPFLLSSISQRFIKIKQKYIFIGVLIVLTNMILSRSRSTFILGALALVAYFIFIYIFQIKALNKRTKYVFYLVAFLLFLFITGEFINLDYLLNRFKKLDITGLSIESIISGEKINRDYAFSFGIDRLSQDSWFVGYGWGTIESNRIAWFGDASHFRAGFHSLYLSLPMIYGWFGSIAFILLILLTIRRLLSIIFHYKNSLNYLVLASIGFLLLLFFFLINQYKINVLREPHYHMVVWIWLGLSHSIINTFIVTIKNRKIFNARVSSDARGFT